ncbi:MAG: hypothetical protein EBQ99_04295 [Planctomycetes bacterium]|nr:hypothetical protein [Planctomycetota bacterium]
MGRGAFFPIGGGGTRFGCFLVGGGGEEGTTGAAGLAAWMGFMPPDAALVTLAVGLAAGFLATFLEGFLVGTLDFRG